jgi:ectoine hydroxylase-related dioxygenase (phytanoyl-CoA dioxygenase family)
MTNDNEEKSSGKHSVKYQVLDPKKGLPSYEITVYATRDEISALIEDGYMVKKNLFSQSEIIRMREEVDTIGLNERHINSNNCFGGQYIRYLMDKSPIFLRLYRLEATLSIARAVLGPQVQFDQVDARVVPAGITNVRVPWHTHLRVIPKPMPPFFCYPHAIHCLLYLDGLDEHNGPLCLLPGSHRKLGEIYDEGDCDDKPGQVLPLIEEGDCLLMHGNLWHRTLPSKETGGTRRLIIFGYMASWMRGDERGGIRPVHSLRDVEFTTGDNEARELLGEFYWP